MLCVWNLYELRPCLPMDGAAEFTASPVQTDRWLSYRSTVWHSGKRKTDMMQEIMNGPMSWGMWLICLLFLVVLGLAAAGLVKYLRS